MIIDTEFNVGDTVFYLQGYTICITTISSISVEWSYADDRFVMVYKLADGSTSLRNDYPKWNRPLFQTQEALFKYLLKENNLHENQTLSIEQMQHLQKIGVDTSNASMVLIATDNDGCTLDWEEALDYMKYGQSDVYFKLLDAEMGDYNHSYREDCGVFTLQDVIDKLPKFITPMPSKQIRFSCFINIFGGIKYVNEDDVNDVLKLIRGNNLLETDEWKGDVNE